MQVCILYATLVYADNHKKRIKMHQITRQTLVPAAATNEGAFSFETNEGA